MFMSCLTYSYIRYYDTNFNPIMDRINVQMKNKRQNIAGSLKTNIPINTVPTAPSKVRYHIIRDTTKKRAQTERVLATWLCQPIRHAQSPPNRLCVSAVAQRS